MGQTFKVIYQIRLLAGEDLREKLRGICVEQSVEYPPSIIPDKMEKDVVGKVDTFTRIKDRTWRVSIDWPMANTGNEISQFINILYGNISLNRGIRIIDLEWPALTDLLKGPRYGIEGIRKKWNIHNRALSCTALKPLGSSPKELGRMCYEFAMGGIDIIKDDHGLANQSYAPFEKRVAACVDAIEKAKRETGIKHYYFPNITGDQEQTLARYHKAYELGADGVLVIPQICGLPVLYQLSRDPADLPIMSHPAFSGGYILHPNEGFAPSCYYGGLWRALGADFIIYANSNGRFSFPLRGCLEINDFCRRPLPGFASSFPTPGGGLKRNELKKWLSLYGRDTVILIGGSLYQHSDGICQAAREFTSMIKFESDKM